MEGRFRCHARLKASLGRLTQYRESEPRQDQGVAADGIAAVRGVERAKPIAFGKGTFERKPAMAKSLYTARAHVVGGRDQGHGVTSDGALDVQLRTPVEMGGDGGVPPSSSSPWATPPASRELSASWDGVNVPNSERSPSIHASALSRPRTGDSTWPSNSMSRLRGSTKPDRAVSIVAAAHEVCPYSNATRGNVDVVLTANGHASGTRWKHLTFPTQK